MYGLLCYGMSLDNLISELGDHVGVCDHEWKTSLGLTKEYKDCTKCGAKWEDYNEDLLDVDGLETDDEHLFSEFQDILNNLE